MPSDQSGQALRDILENARLARSFITGLAHAKAFPLPFLNPKDFL